MQNKNGNKKLFPNDYDSSPQPSAQKVSNIKKNIARITNVVQKNFQLSGHKNVMNLGSQFSEF